MRRLVSSVILAFGLVMTGAGGASAEPAPSAGPAKATPGKKVCKVDNPLLNELSGLVATKSGYIVVNDGVESVSRRRVFFLDGECNVTKQVPYPTTPRDPEDLALSPDGKTLWIADIGDNAGSPERRESIALWSMPADGSKRPVIHRLTYPDGKHDAEALLINGDGKPIVVTKEPGKAGLYVPTAPLKKNNDEGVRMVRAGEVKLPSSTTSNPLLGPGRLIVTGGAVSPDGSRVVLRTYADAFEWDVQDGDVVNSVKAQPRATPLPDEPFGEAIAYSPDGESFLTVSDMGEYSDDEEIANHILRYTPAAEVSVPAAGADTQPKSDGLSWFQRLTLQEITNLVGAAGVIGALFVIAGVIGIVRARRRPGTATAVGATAAVATATAAAPVAAAAAPVAAGPDGPGRGRWPATAGDYRSGHPADGFPGAAGQQSGAVYGGGAGPSAGRPPSGPARGAVYGGAPGPNPSKGSVYGGAAPSARPGGYGPGAPPEVGGSPAAGQYGYAGHGAGRLGAVPVEPAYPDDYGFEPGGRRP